MVPRELQSPTLSSQEKSRSFRYWIHPPEHLKSMPSVAVQIDSIAVMHFACLPCVYGTIITIWWRQGAGFQDFWPGAS